MPAFALTPRIVPSVEKKSPQNAVKIRITDEKLNTDLKSRLNMTLPSPVKSGTLANVDGTVVTPAGIPSRVTIMIPIKIAPFTLYAVRIAMMTSPRTASITAGSVKFPMPIPLSVKDAMPVFLNPRYAIKKPIAVPMDILMFFGIALTIRSRIPNIVSNRKIRPEIRVIAIAPPKESCWL